MFASLLALLFLLKIRLGANRSILDSQRFYNKILLLKPDHEHLTRFSSMQKFNIPRHCKSMSEKQFLYNAIK